MLETAQLFALVTEQWVVAAKNLAGITLLSAGVLGMIFFVSGLLWALAVTGYDIIMEQRPPRPPQCDTITTTTKGD